MSLSQHLSFSYSSEQTDKVQIIQHYLDHLRQAITQQDSEDVDCGCVV